MPRTICFTSFTFAYLARAQVLAETLRAAHPDWELWALIVDEFPPGLEPAALAAFDRVVPSATLGIPRYRAWLFKHDVVEACTAVKGSMLRRLLAEGADRVVYLDPDIAVFHPLAGLDCEDADASVVLTPHQLAPNTAAMAIRDDEMGSLRYGTYNLGFIAVRNDAPGRAFADWWAETTLLACYDDPDAGIFTDQKYCDLVPAMFDNVRIARDPGYNVASWNLSRRHIEVAADGALLVNGVKLRFYHFTKIGHFTNIGSVGDIMTERYAGDNTEVYEIVNWYKRQIARTSIQAADDWPWSHARFDNGEQITRGTRLLWRSRTDLFAAYDDPFATGPGSLHAWLTREQPDLLEG